MVLVTAVIVAVVVTGVVVTATQRSFLIEQVDTQLHDASRPIGRISLPGQPGFPGGDIPPDQTQNGNPPTALSELWIGDAGTDGRVTERYAPGLGGGTGAAPTLTAGEIRAGAASGQAFTVGSSSDGDFRVLAIGRSDGSTLVVGLPLDRVDRATNRLWVALGLGALAIVAIVALLAWWVWRLGLRPIRRMTATADAITAGDTTLRVEEASTTTEAGRLAVAMNQMLDERQASEDRLRRFIADASHELRTPLTSIRGYTELYRSGAITDGPQLVDAMRRIEGESERMGELVDDMLLLARLDQGRPLDSQLVDLDALAADAVADARAVEPDRPISLDVSGPSTEVMGDEQRLRQMVGNLLANARQHTPRDAAVDVRVWSEDDQAMLEVADRGPGMAAEDAAHVFERFYRADPSRVRAAEGGIVASGAGLGLSIVAAVASAHHGRSWVESAPGAGARFRVELPLAGSDPQPSLPEPA